MEDEQDDVLDAQVIDAFTYGLDDDDKPVIQGLKPYVRLDIPYTPFPVLERSWLKGGFKDEPRNRLRDEAPSVVNSPEALGPLPKGAATFLAAVQAAEAREVRVLWGQGRLAKRRKADADSEAKTRMVMEDVTSVSVRAWVAGRRVAAVWANGKYSGGGVDGRMGYGIRDLTDMVKTW